MPELQSPAQTPAPAPAAEQASPAAQSSGDWMSWARENIGFGQGGTTSYAPNGGPSYELEKGSLSRTSNVNAVGGPGSAKASGSVRGDGASAAYDRSIKTESNGVTTRGNLLGGADATAKVEATSDPAFGLLVVTFTFGGEGGFGVGGVGREASAKDPEAVEAAPVAAPEEPDFDKHVAAEVSANVGLKVKGSCSLALRHRLPIAEANEIAAELQLPFADRYAILDRIGLLADEFSAAENLLAPLDPAVAAALAPSEGMEFSFGGEVGVNGAAKASAGASAGLTASATASAKRTVRVEGNPDAKEGQTVKVTVTFEDGAKGSVGATASDGIAAVGASAGQGQSSKRTFEVVMDPNDPMYEGDFHTLVSALDAAAIVPIAARLKAKRAATQTTTSESNVEAALLGLGLQLGSTKGRTNGTELGAGGLSGVESGESTENLGTSLFGFQLMGQSHAEKADAKFGSGGASVAIVATDKATKRFTADKTTTSSLKLGTSDLIRLGKRFVENRAVWDAIGMDHWKADIGAWSACGASLAWPVPDVELLKAGMPLPLAVEGARYAAIATLAADGKGQAQPALLAACGAEWGVRCAARGEATASDAFGLAIAWPAGLEEQNDVSVALEKRWERLGPSVAAVTDEVSADRVLSDLDRDDEVLASLQDAVAAHADAFADQPLVAVGLLVLLAERRAMIADWRGEVARRETGTSDVDAPAETAVDPALEVARLEGILVGFKPQESALFDQLEAASASGWEDGPSAWLTADPKEASHRIRDLGFVYLAWVPQILALRTAYRAAAIDEADWMISAGPCEARKLDCEPDLERFQALRGTEGQKVATLLTSY